MTEPREVEPVSSTDDERLTVAFLPHRIRERVIGLASDGIGRMPAETLPSSLKRVASFAPGRRAKLAGNQIASALEHDSDFRAHLARQVRTQIADLATALDAGAVPAAIEPVDLAAVAFIIRPHGWAQVVSDAVATVTAEHQVQTSRKESEQAARLQFQLETALDELKAIRQRHRDELAAIKAENADLRRKLGDARLRLQGAESDAKRAQSDAATAQQALGVSVSQLEADIRRLRGRIEELEGELAATRRADRSGRDTGTLRARLLLDTLLDTAQGLRRELALPAIEGAPADSVEAHLAEEGVRPSSGHGSLQPDDPAMLDALLALPRVHMIIDGYNVTKTTWPGLSLERQRDRLLNGLAPLVARTGAEITVVFDAAEKKERPLVNGPRGVRVLFSPHGVIADDIIRELVAAEPQGRPLVVVSSDREILRDVNQVGARSAASRALAGLLGRT